MYCGGGDGQHGKQNDSEINEANAQDERQGSMAFQPWKKRNKNKTGWRLEILEEKWPR